MIDSTEYLTSATEHSQAAVTSATMVIAGASTHCIVSNGLLERIITRDFQQSERRIGTLKTKSSKQKIAPLLSPKRQLGIIPSPM